VPTYDYECTLCQKTGEFFASMSESNAPPNCECGAPSKRVILSAPMGYVHFPAAGGQGYVSPTSGKFIDTKRARIDDLKRSGCRPYEGFEQESKEVARNNAYAEKKADDKLHDVVSKAYHELSPDKRAALNE
jgi:putative FmdB family regulatory protein